MVPLHLFQELAALRCEWLFLGRRENCVEVVEVEETWRVFLCDTEVLSVHLEKKKYSGSFKDSRLLQ